MKKQGSWLIHSVLLITLSEQASAKILAKSGEYVVKIRSNSLGPATSLFTARLGNSKYLSRLGEFRLKKIRSKQELDDLKKSPEVEYVEPNYIYTISSGARSPKPAPAPVPPPATTPQNPNREEFPELKATDPYFSLLWGLKNIGQQDPKGLKGIAKADIAATGAWTQGTGSKKVVVAVIDTGIDLDHPDLKNNLWKKPKVKATDPDIHGYNAIDNNYDPQDDNGHGTHVAGTIGAMGGNGVGVVGVSWEVSLMALKFMDAGGSGTLADAIESIDFARENGAHIMNNSWGGGGYSQALYDAIERAEEAGILFVAAAGNDSNNNDTNPSYPASYNLPNVISVAASNNKEQLASFSNYGANSVHIAAPGVNILSTYLNGRYESLSGTSMAAPHVAGAAALYLSLNPGVSGTELKQKLIDSAEKLPASYQGKVANSARLNVYNLVQ